MLFELLIIGFAIYIIWKISQAYKLNTFDTVLAFTGGPGSGKSFLSVDQSIRLLKRKRREVWWKNLLRKKGSKLPFPLLYSSIPVQISKHEKAVILTDKHLTLQEKLVPRSVCFIDEIGSFCSQFDYKSKNADIFDEFVRFYRHYTWGGYLVCNDQCSENIVLQVRRRLNTVYNLMGFRKWFGIIYTVKVRNITVSEEIKTIEENNTEDNMRTLIGFLPLRKRYDTYCYAPRYEYVPNGEVEYPQKLTKLDILRLPKNEVLKLDTRITMAQKEEQKKKIEQNSIDPLDK